MRVQLFSIVNTKDQKKISEAYARSIKRWLKAAFIALLLGFAVNARIEQGQLTVPHQTIRPSQLFKDGRHLLAFARAQGQRDVVLLVAAAPGRSEGVARAAVKLGGEVRYREDDVDYLRVRVPIQGAFELIESDAIESLTIDDGKGFPGALEFSIYDGLQAKLTPRPIQIQAPPVLNITSDNRVWPPVWSDYPLSHPYSPLADIDAEQFVKEHPTFDGRGVTIAVVDGNLDLLMPEFNIAYTLDGKRVPKVADFINASDPRDDATQVPQWVNMKEQVVARDRHVIFRGKGFTTPRDGNFRIGLFDERRNGIPDQDIDRNGNPEGDDGLFGVLWDEQTNDVWVDTNRNLGFADEKTMTNYVQRHDVGVFGKDNPATAVRESIGFTVQTDSKNKFVSINTGVTLHTTLIMGAVIGNVEPKGRIQGIAPGARIVSISIGSGDSIHTRVEGWIAAFKNPQVDLVVSVAPAAHRYTLGDNHHLVSIIGQRLIERYNKLWFAGGGNLAGFGTVETEGLAPTAISVSGYQSQESYKINFGVVPEEVDHMHWAGRSHGPSGIGGLKPDLLAPSGCISTGLGFQYSKLEPFNVVRGLFQLPPGYRFATGTSAATPIAAGAAALVVSAAKQTGLRFDAKSLKAALVGSARYIRNLKANEQGNGLIQVKAAYELMKKMQRTPAITIESRAPVRTRLSKFLRTPNLGIGIYEREGWALGDQGTRTITFTRTSGPTEPMTFNLSWLGNDGTFSSGTSLTLPLNKPVDLSVAIAIKETGSHASILTLNHPSVPGHAYSVLNTVVAPFRFTAENDYTIITEISMPLPDDRGIFVDIPPGTAALSFSANGKVSLHPISPSRAAGGWTVEPAGIVGNPESGIWEINIVGYPPAPEFDPDYPQPLKPTKVKLTVAVARTQLETDTIPAEKIKSGATIDVPVKLTNQFGPVYARVTGGALGNAFKTKRTTEQGEQQVYEVMIPKGATLLYARVSGVMDARADLDVYLFECTSSGAKCENRAKDDKVGPDGEVRVLNPAPGKWKIVVDAYSVPSGRTTYNYLDVYTCPKYGSVMVTDIPEKLETGATRGTTAHIWVASVPERGRRLEAQLVAASPELKDGDGNMVPLGSLNIQLGPPVP